MIVRDPLALSEDAERTCYCKPVVLIPGASVHPYREWNPLCAIHYVLPHASVGDLIESYHFGPREPGVDERPRRYRVRMLIVTMRSRRVRLLVEPNRLIPDDEAGVVRRAAPYALRQVTPVVPTMGRWQLTFTEFGIVKRKVYMPNQAQAYGRMQDWMQQDCPHPERDRWGLHCGRCGTVDVHPPRGRRA